MSDIPPIESLPAAENSADTPPPDAPRITGYEILGLLGQGPLGLVWRAVKADTARLVALKLVPADLLADNAAWIHFERDADVAASLNHPYIPRLLENKWRDQVFCLATELIEGAPIDLYARRQKLTARAVLCLIAKISDAVQSAHAAGLIHGRLKPTNILITTDGEPHILDFGLTQLCPARTAADLTEHDETDGAHACLAPEQLTADTEYADTHTDVYSLGAILFRLLTGQWPGFAAAAPVPIGIDADPELTALLAKALARNPHARYSSAGEFARDIRRYLAGEPLRAIEPTATYWIRKALALYRIPVTIVAALLVWLTVTGAIRLLTLIGERNQAVLLLSRLEERNNRTTALLRRQQNTNQAATTSASTPTNSPAASTPPTDAELYDRLLQAARLHLAAGALDQADAVLWEAPPASRNRDWADLLRASHPDLWTLRPAGGVVTAVALAPDAKRLALAGADTVTIWTGDPLQERHELRAAAKALVFSPDGRRLATTGADGTTTVWDALTGRSLRNLKHAAHAIAFTPAGDQLLLATTLPAELITVDLATGDQQRAPLGDTPLNSAAFSADGRLLITGNDTQVQVWDPARNRVRWTYRFPSPVVAVALSADGLVAVAAGRNGRFQLWENVNGRELLSLQASDLPATPLLFTPDGHGLLTGNTLWDLRTGKENKNYPGPPSTAAFAPDSKRVVIGQRDGAVRWWSTLPAAELSVTDFGITREDFLKLKQARTQNLR